jgi:ferrous iron transport protein A
MGRLIPIRQMQVEQEGVVRKITAKAEMGRRLREMGIIPGVRITVQGRAPLKDPVAIKVMDSVLTLRNNEADYVLVEVD